MRTTTVTGAVMAALAAAFLAGAAHAVPQSTQAISLKTGWNAVFLEVQPPDPDPAAVFAGFPAGVLSSAWLWVAGNSTVQFIQNPTEGEWEQQGWFGYRPGQPASFSNLHAIPGGRPYLVKVTGDFTWTVTGRPVPRRIAWVPDSFNYVGARLDPAGPAPTFAAFFASSPAHKGQAIYRLNNATGAWRFVNNPAAEAMTPGEAFWIYAEGGSDYQGPLDLELERADGVDFGLGGEQDNLTVTNRSGAAITVSIGYAEGPAVPEVLIHRVFADRSFTWEPLSTLLPFDLAPGKKEKITLGVRRELMTGDTYETVLEVAAGTGDRVLVPVSVRR